MGNHKGCPYGRLVVVYFGSKYTEVWSRRSWFDKLTTNGLGRPRERAQAATGGSTSMIPPPTSSSP